MNKITSLLSGIALMVSTSVWANTPTDLSGWMTEGSGSWSYDNNTNTWLQSQNGQPTYLFGNTDALGKVVSGEVEVKTNSDDDFFGFAIGFNQDDYSNPNANYFLLTWKQNDQSGASRGVDLWHVTGAMSTNSAALFNPAGAGSLLNPIGTAATFSDAAWSSYTPYTFDLTYDTNAFGVFINDTLEYAITPSDVNMNAFATGTFAFFNYSQAYVSYGGVVFDDIGNVIDDEKQDELDDATNVPVSTAGMALVMMGLGGWLRRKV